jgi:hypothetical protein
MFQQLFSSEVEGSPVGIGHLQADAESGSGSTQPAEPRNDPAWRVIKQVYGLKGVSEVTIF